MVSSCNLINKSRKKASTTTTGFSGFPCDYVLMDEGKEPLGKKNLSVTHITNFPCLNFKFNFYHLK